MRPPLRSLVFASLLVSLVCPIRAEVPIVNDGKRMAFVVIPERANVVAKYAA
jgi:hypothetical protein